MERWPGARLRTGRGAGFRVSSGLAGFVCLFCVGLAVGGLILALLNGRTLGEILAEENILAIAVLTVAFSVVGALIASHRSGTSIGWIFCAVGLFQGLASFGYEYATYALLTQPGSLPLGAPMSWVGNWTWAPGLGLVLVFLPLLFPDGRPPSRRWWWAGWVGGASVATITAMAAVFLWPERGPALLRSPTGEEQGPQWVLDIIVEYVAFPLMLAAGLAAVASLLVRFRRSRGDERRQIQWVAYAGGLVTLVLALQLGVETVLPGAERLLEVLNLALVVAFTGVPLAAGAAILKYGSTTSTRSSTAPWCTACSRFPWCSCTWAASWC